MKIGLIDVDFTGYPNIALMKISQYHKNKGDETDWVFPFEHYDKIYMSKIFNFSQEESYIYDADEIIKGGTGYDIHSSLPAEIEYCQPDYDLYNIKKNVAYGFLTRGPLNKCAWCVVPEKEDKIRPYMDIDDITQGGKRPTAILMDNNVLASDFGLEQLIKISDKKYRVDFNQSLDARLVTKEIAEILAKIKWIKRIRFSCDTLAQIESCNRAVDLISRAGYKGEFLFYCILNSDIKDSLYRIEHWTLRCYLEQNRRYIPFAQPFRNLDYVNDIPQWQKDMARWCNRKELLFSTRFEDYEPRKGEKCEKWIQNYQ